VKEARADKSSDLTRVQELDAQFKALLRRNAGLVSAIRFECARDEMQPDGYMGLNTEVIQVNKIGDAPALYHFGPTAQVVSVDPGSPAEKAGIAAHDQLLTIGGFDVQKPIPLGALLKPTSRLPVRVLRDGKTHDVVVIVGKRPEDAGSPCSGVGDMLAATAFAPQTMVFRNGKPGGDGYFSAPVGGGSRAVAGTLPGDGSAAFPRSGAASGYAFVMPFPKVAADQLYIGGATFFTLDGNWRETLKVDKGLLVMMVAPGGPAETAGLRPSDVVVAVGDSAITSPGVLLRQINSRGSAGVPLKVLRAGKAVTVTLKLMARDEP
jgi:membrane-associated protease RseP (regulator of RpoE activity)